MGPILKQFRTVLLLSGLIGILTIGIMVYSLLEIQDYNTRQHELEQLERGIFELTILSEDYLLTRSPRAKKQWLSKFDGVKQQLGQVEAGLGQELAVSELLHDIRQSLHLLGQNFRSLMNALAASEGTRRARLEQLSTSSLYLAQHISSNANQISAEFENETEENYLLMVSLLIAAVILAKVGILWMINSLRKRTRDSINLLHKSVAGLADGVQLVELPSPKKEDEFANLLSKFKKVSVLLDQRYRRLIEQIEDQKQKAEKASEAKSTFLANVSHEIRTPLSIIDGYAALLRETGGPEKSECIAKIRWNVSYVVGLINEILDLSKIESGKMEKAETEFNLIDLSSVFSSLKQKAQFKQLYFNVHSGSPLPGVIKTDKVKLEQILMNVIGNAIKFTDHGGIHVEVEYLSKTLSFVISDTGIGIAPEKHTQLFTLFYQADSSLSQKTKGTGLGLVLARKMARLLGGDVELRESVPGKGSVFQVTIALSSESFSSTITGQDLVTIQPALNTPALRQKFKGLKVLLAEDNLDLRDLTKHRISSLGAAVTAVENGAEAVEAVAESPQEFDIILLDIQMPVMDGYTAVHKMRELGFQKPIVACSARLMKEEREKGVEAGFSDYLEKPVVMAKLIDLCSRLILPTPQDHEPEIRTTMVVDEDVKELFLNMIRRLPEYQSALIRAIESGDDAQIKTQLHQIKGMLLSYGFGRTAEKCEVLEAQASVSLLDCQSLLDDFETIGRTYACCEAENL